MSYHPFNTGFVFAILSFIRSLSLLSRPCHDTTMFLVWTTCNPEVINSGYIGTRSRNRKYFMEYPNLL